MSPFSERQRVTQTKQLLLTESDGWPWNSKPTGHKALQLWVGNAANICARQERRTITEPFRCPFAGQGLCGCGGKAPALAGGSKGCGRSHTAPGQGRGCGGPCPHPIKPPCKATATSHRTPLTFKEVVSRFRNSI